MSETYVECMVARKPSILFSVLKYLFLGLCIFTGLIALVLGYVVFLIAAILFGVLAYFANGRCGIEYEYLYLDKEITVDKVMNKSKRKRVAVYEVDKMEIIAPINSHQLDSYRNRTAKDVDYSSGIAKQPDHRFVFFYNGMERVIIEPSPELIKAVKTIAPRKVFLD